MKYLPLLMIFAVISSGVGAAFAIGDSATIGDSAVPTVHRGTMISTGDTVSATDSSAVPEFGPIAALILAIAIVSIIAVSAKTGLKFMPKY